MRLLWAYEHDFAAISPFLSQRIGTFCHHPRWSLWLEQRTTGWRSGRSEGDSKSLSVGYIPTDLLLLNAANVPSGSQVISLVHPTGRPAFHWVCHPRLGCRSQHRGMGLRPLRMKVRWGCPPQVLSPPPHRTQSWRPCLPRQPWVSGWKSTDRPVPNPCGWMIGFSERGAAHNRVLLRCLFSPEVHEELTKSWMAPFTTRSRSSISSVLTTLDGGAARGYAGIPQVERAVAVHLCPPNAATWRNCPRFPSKACKLMAALAAKTYSAAGQAAFALHAMAILQLHQAKALKQVHEGSTDPGLMPELRTATDFALRAMKVTARSLGKAMSTMVVQERYLWLNLAEMKDVDKARFLDAPISQAGLFGDTVEGFAQQISAVQQQTEAIQHILPRRDAQTTAAPGARPQSAITMGALLCPPELLRPRLNRHLGRRVEPLAGERRPPCPSQAPSRPGSRQSGPDAGNPEMLEFALSQKMARTVPLLPPEEGREENPMFLFCFCSPLSQRKSNFNFLRALRFMGRQCATPCFLTLTHDPSFPQPRECGSGTQYLPTQASLIWETGFGEDASERATFCTIQPYSPSLHHNRYVDCAVGDACMASVGVAHAAQPVSLAHEHKSTRLRNSVRQATSQVQRRSRDFGGSPEHPCLVRGDCCPPGKGCNRAGPSIRDEAGVSQPLLHHIQERWSPINP